MTRVTFVIAAMVFAGSVNAFEGSCFEKNNPDLYSGYTVKTTSSAENPGVGDRKTGSDSSSTVPATSYENWVSGNPDQRSGT